MWVLEVGTLPETLLSSAQDLIRTLGQLLAQISDPLQIVLIIPYNCLGGLHLGVPGVAPALCSGLTPSGVQETMWCWGSTPGLLHLKHRAHPSGAPLWPFYTFYFLMG